MLRYFLAFCSLVFGVAHYRPDWPWLGAVYGFIYYVFTNMSFLQSIESDSQELRLEAHALVGQRKKIREAQKPVNVCVDGNPFEFYLQEILLIEYFKFLCREGTNNVNFNSPNLEVMGPKIKKNWGVDKASSLAKLVQKSRGGSFRFLELKTSRGKKNAASNSERIDSVSSYLSLSGFTSSKRKFDEFYKKCG